MDPLCAHLGVLTPLFPEVFDSQFGFGSKTLNRKQSGFLCFCFYYFNLFLFCLQSKVSLCSPGAPFLDQADLKLRETPDCLQSAGITTAATTTWLGIGL